MQTFHNRFSISTAAVAATITMALAAGCGVDADADAGATDDVAQSALTVTPPPRCPGIPSPLVTSVYSGGGEGFHGTQGYATGYGNLCTPYFVIETTNTLGVADLELVVGGTTDAALDRSSLACALASITVEVWGCVADSTGACDHWVSVGKTTNSGLWHTGGGCSLHASLPATSVGSPYTVLRLGGLANKQILGDDGKLTPVQLPVTEHIGFNNIIK